MGGTPSRYGGAPTRDADDSAFFTNAARDAPIDVEQLLGSYAHLYVEFLKRVRESLSEEMVFRGSVSGWKRPGEEKERTVRLLGKGVLKNAGKNRVSSV